MADPATADLLRLRLKPKAPAPASQEMSPPVTPPPELSPAPEDPLAPPEIAPPPAIPPAAVFPPLQPPPTTAIKGPSRAGTQPPFVPPPAVPHLRPAGSVPEVKVPPVSRTAPPAVYKADKWLAIVAIVLAVVGAYCAFRVLKARLAKPDAPATTARAAAQPATSSAPSSTAGKAIAKARESIAAHDQAAAAANAPIEQAQTAVATPKPPVKEEPLPPPPPGEAFRAFVVNLRISGVFQGAPPRTLLNGKMYRVGDTVDTRLGIKLVSIDPENKQLNFTDLNGARMSRRY